MNLKDFEVPVIGKCRVKSPLNLSNYAGQRVFQYIKDNERILYDTTLDYFKECQKNNIEPISFEKAGPKELLYFDPTKTKVAIVTCGGLCPGLNDVIRSLVMELWHRYHVKRITGIKYGYAGFISEKKHDIVELRPDVVDQIHLFGGTILGSSRGHQDIEEIVDSLEMMNINILFCIGGDGTLRAAQLIHEEIQSRGIKIVVAGIPKTIDNDINFTQRSFGFETAFSKANEVIRDAHNEAEGAYNGISIVKLMGRDAGFIAAHSTLSMQEVNFVIIPEMDFELYGENGLLEQLKKRVISRHHALIVVSEGAGQHLFDNENTKTDASGNVKYRDIGLFLKDKIKEYFTHEGIEHTIKYIDPSYIIRSATANANDSKFCTQLAQNAVHGAMCGKTGFVVAYHNHHFVWLPIPITVQERKRISLKSELWWNVLEVTGQPYLMKNQKDNKKK